jgi:hypothetical protein
MACIIVHRLDWAPVTPGDDSALAERSLPRRLASEGRSRANAWTAGRRARRQTRGRRTLIVGPWTSEVGFELLYWIPFLRGLFARNGVDPRRVVALSRGGVGAWYADIAGRYQDVLDVVSVAALRDDHVQRDAAGAQKQLRPTALDAEILSRVREAIGDREAAVLHPSAMYNRFRVGWSNERTLARLRRELVFAPLHIDAAAPPGLSLGGYVAVKAYFSDAFPAEPRNAARLRELVQRLTDDRPVVMLRSGVALDEHADVPLDDVPGLVCAPTGGVPTTNLGDQAAIVAGARALVATYGGFAYLGPLVGTPTYAFHSTDDFSPLHLRLLRDAVAPLPRGKSQGSEDRFTLFHTDDPSTIRKLTEAPA